MSMRSSKRGRETAVTVAPSKSRKVDPESPSPDVRATSYSIGSKPSTSAERLFAHAIKFELLTPQEEQVLAQQRIEADRAISLLERSLAEAERRKKPALCTKLQKDLSSEIERRDAAVCTLIERNIRLAIKVAGDYGFLPTELEMRIASAIDGLREAALRFEATKAKFSTYASWWMRQRILRDSISQGRAIRLPVHMAQRVFKVAATENELRSLYGRAATDDEVAEHLKLSAKQMRDVRLAQQTLTVSMEPMPDAFDNTEERDQVADPNALIPGTELLSVDRKELLQKSLGLLDKRERAIIDARFGFGASGKKETLETVGKRFHVTRERIRQLENIALKKLRRQFEKLDVPVMPQKYSK